MAKYIFVTGGVVSGLGKGITAASLGRLLKSRGLHVTMQKFDPYINYNPASMSPFQHGEVFVADDGAETDLDIGHYERFIDENLGQNSNITAGKIYWSVISKERQGKYGGSTVQVIPHVTNEIKDRIHLVAKDNATDIVITEIGGTVGDIESLPFLEAARQIAVEVGRENCMYIHVTLMPYISKSGEQKTKPTQHSVKELLALGIQPDVIVLRSEHKIAKESREKIGLFCNIPSECVIQNLDADSIYEVPLHMEEEGLAKVVCKRLNIPCTEPNLQEWRGMVDKILALKAENAVEIALVGKYVSMFDAYLSVSEALHHGGIVNGVKVKIKWVNSDTLSEKNVAKMLKGVKGIIMPDGVGELSVEGMVCAAKYARENKIPFFGICNGMQMAVVEFARNVAGIENANSAEQDAETPFPVIHLVHDDKNADKMARPMRLGLFPCKVDESTKLYSIYNDELIYERHRHKYELNNEYRKMFVEKGLVISGLSPDERLVEAIEIKDHPWYVAVQYHPEYKSRPNKAHPLFVSFVKAAKETK